MNRRYIQMTILVAQSLSTFVDICTFSSESHDHANIIFFFQAMNFLQAVVFATLIGCLLQTASSANCDEDYCYTEYDNCLGGCSTHTCMEGCENEIRRCTSKCKKRRVLRPVPSYPDRNEVNDDSFLDVFQD